MICPRCNQEYEGFPALSRRDNETDICSDCGTEEAMIDAGFCPDTENEMKFVQKLEVSGVEVNKNWR